MTKTMKGKSTKPTPKKEKKERREWKKPFIAALARSPNVSGAAAAAKIDRSYAYKEREKDKDFAAQWDSAIGVSVDKLEAEAFKRAMKSSDTLAIFLLKSHRPDRYRETTRSLNLNITPEQIAQLSDEDLDRYIAALARRS